MCNPAEQAGVEYASDPKKKNVLILEMDSANASMETSKGSDNHSNGSSVEINDAVVHLSSDSLIEANGIVGDHHSCDTSDHSTKEVLISGVDGEEGVEGVDHTREPVKTCVVMANSFAEVDGIPKSSRIEEEALQETSKGIAGELVTLHGLSDGASGRTSIKAVEAPDSTSVSGENDSAAEELLIDPCKGVEKPETQTNMCHADDTIEVHDPLLLEGLAGGSEGHSTAPCTEANGIMVEHNSELSLGAKEQFLMDFDRSLAWIDMKPHSSQGGAEWIAASSEESSKEDAAEHVRCSFKEANEETLSEIEQQGTIVSSVQVLGTDTVVLQGHGLHELAEFSKADAAEHAPRSFKEANEETPREREQEGATIPSIQAQITDIADIKGNSPPELAEFFSSARGSKPEKEIEEQEYAPAPAKLPPKKKLFMESPRSLRMLLFSEETALMSKKDEKHKKDGKAMEFSSKVVPAAEIHGNGNHTEPNYPAKWYEDADNGETSSAFSGPIAYSGALTYQGLMAVPYSGSISHRSDSSASTRSFAFPILASDWNSSPVKMGAPDPRYYRQRRKWHFCFCCSRGSTLFD